MKKFFAFSSMLLLTFFICSGCQPVEERTYTDAEAQRNMDYAAKLWNGGDISLIDSLYSDESMYHSADFVNAKGTEEIKNFVKWVYSTYPDFAVTLDEPMKFKDRMVITFKATGTNDGPLAEDMPSTGKKMSFNGVSIIKMENGKIIEEWVYYNQLYLYNQLGYKLAPIVEKKTKK